ncbi:hypothetical protein [Streptomyces sp. NPDC006195]|uniref:hypothetical protein n=1 Tax=unclassified Streptomyces TaxID=2593676 RepID=UPI0033AF1C66
MYRSRSGLPAGVLVKGPQLMAGHPGQERRAARTEEDGRFSAGDAGCLDGGGALCRVDRLARMVMCGDEIFPPGRTERIISGDPRVAGRTVAGRPGPVALLPPGARA